MDQSSTLPHSPTSVEPDDTPLATLTMRAPPASRIAEGLAHLPEFDLGQPNDDADLLWLDTLGEGGMGVVRLAHQTAVQRPVAVKTAAEDASPQTVDALLQEAFITGYLEHPNIIPIYTVGRTSDRRPLIVMKRVSGTVWSDLLDREHGDGQLDLDRHIEILIQIARAIRFAHSKDIVHRDIKTENVMIGDFGEVYLLDWGIARCLRGDRPLLPSLNDDQGACGTPGYLAPEMTPHVNRAIDKRTDIYLLGATLHFILTGRTRHRADSIPHFFELAARSQPHHYPPDIPSTLAAIANRACHPNSDERYQSAQAFEEALQDYLRHRESTHLSNRADDKRRLLRRQLAQDRTDLTSIENLFGECRFAYNEALRLWDDNSAARDGLQACLVMMANHYLQRRQLESAKACIDDLPQQAPQLRDRYRQLLDEQRSNREDVARLKAMEQELDVTTASSTRSILMVILGLIWTGTSLFGAFRYGPATTIPTSELGSYAISGVRNMLIAFVAVAAFHKKMFTNVANRRLVTFLLSFVTAVALLRGATWYTETGYFISRIGEFTLAGLLMVAIGLVSDLRICLFVLLFVGLAIFALIWPEYHLLARPVAIGITFFGFAWLWTPNQVQKRIELSTR